MSGLRAQRRGRMRSKRPFGVEKEKRGRLDSAERHAWSEERRSTFAKRQVSRSASPDLAATRLSLCFSESELRVTGVVRSRRWAQEYPVSSESPALGCKERAVQRVERRARYRGGRDYCWTTAQLHTEGIGYRSLNGSMRERAHGRRMRRGRGEVGERREEGSMQTKNRKERGLDPVVDDLGLFQWADEARRGQLGALGGGKARRLAPVPGERHPLADER